MELFFLDFLCNQKNFSKFAPAYHWISVKGETFVSFLDRINKI